MKTLQRLFAAALLAVCAALAVMAGIEVARWAVFLCAVVQFFGAWVGWQTRIRMALLDSLVSDPGPVDDRLPGSSGEAVT